MLVRRMLARRLIQIAALSASAAGLHAAAGCSSGPTCGGPVGDPHQVCIDPSKVQGAKDGGAFENGCPTGELAYEALVQQADEFGAEIQQGPTPEGKDCCYVVQEHSDCTGRPFLVGDRPVSAPATEGAAGWRDAGDLLPRTGDLSAEARAALAAAWARDGLFEHASVASFGRFALELLAVGAPAELVEGAHRAALDEVRHARLCLSLASSYAGAPIGPGGFPFAGSVEVTDDLASIAARAAREGCIGETIAAVQAEEQLARATDPAVRAVLAVIAVDEARHAELAWRTVVWAVQKGGDRVRAAVAEALGGLDDALDEACVDGARIEGALDAHGRLEPEEQRRIAASAVIEVIRPAARLLLRAGAEARASA